MRRVRRARRNEPTRYIIPCRHISVIFSVIFELVRTPDTAVAARFSAPPGAETFDDRILLVPRSRILVPLSCGLNPGSTLACTRSFPHPQESQGAVSVTIWTVSVTSEVVFDILYSWSHTPPAD